VERIRCLIGSNQRLPVNLSVLNVNHCASAESKRESKYIPDFLRTPFVSISKTPGKEQPTEKDGKDSSKASTELGGQKRKSPEDEVTDGSPAKKPRGSIVQPPSFTDHPAELGRVLKFKPATGRVNMRRLNRVVVFCKSSLLL